MEKLMNFVENKIGPVAGKLSANRIMKSIQKGTMYTLPLVLVAGLIILIAKPPIPIVNGEPTMLAGWYYWGLKQTWIMTINSVFNGITGLVFLIGALYSASIEYEMNPVNPLVLGVGSYFLIASTPETLKLADDTVVSAIAFKNFGTSGIFVAIIITIVVIFVIRFFQKYNIGFKFPDVVPAFVKVSFDGILPALSLALIFLLSDNLCKLAIGSNLFGVINAVFEPLVKSFDNVLVVAFFMMLINFFWYMGIHGSVVASITSPIALAYATENTAAYANGAPILHWFTNSTKFGLVLVGGAAVLGLVILCKFSKSKTLRQVGNVGLIPSIFNISEPTIFGMPVMFNKYLFIPFMLVPVVNTFIVWFATDIIKVMNGPIVNAPYQAPFVILPVLAHGSWVAGVVAVVILAIDIVIYFPFFKKYEMTLIEVETKE